jgi:antitoxin component of MazEF toxin-antitoxin module
MQQVRVRNKHQVTLPMAIMRGAGLAENDLLNVQFKNGVITLTPAHQAAPKASLMSFVGATTGLYGSDASEVRDYLERERDSWER